MSRTAPTLAVAVIALVALWASPSCRARQTTRPPAGDVLATVNGVPVTRADVLLASRGAGHDSTAMPESSMNPAIQKNILETIIREELVAQRAAELGLTADAEEQRELRRREAELSALRRKVLSAAYYRHERAEANVTEQEARRYFDANAARLRTELHVWQILLRDEGRIEQARREIESGTPFEEVARRQFPGLPQSSPSPWDLGYLKWNQVPEAWRSVVYALANGQHSGVVRGPRGRLWILKLIDKREDPSITFAGAEATIIEILRSERIEARRVEADRSLRSKARIVYAPAASGR